MIRANLSFWKKNKTEKRQQQIRWVGFWKIFHLSFPVVYIHTYLLCMYSVHSSAMHIYRGVGYGWAGWAVAHPVFSISVTHISNRGDRLCPLPIVLLALPDLGSFLHHWRLSQPKLGKFLENNVLQKLQFPSRWFEVVSLEYWQGIYSFTVLP